MDLGQQEIEKCFTTWLLNKFILIIMQSKNRKIIESQLRSKWKIRFRRFLICSRRRITMQLFGFLLNKNKGVKIVFILSAIRTKNHRFQLNQYYSSIQRVNINFWSKIRTKHWFVVGTCILKLKVWVRPLACATFRDQDFYHLTNFQSKSTIREYIQEKIRLIRIERDRT